MNIMHTPLAPIIFLICLGYFYQVGLVIFGLFFEQIETWKELLVNLIPYHWLYERLKELK
jgi:hypothetical protein